MKKFLLCVVLFGIIGSLIFAFKGKEAELKATDFEILTVEKGRIVEEVTASGKIQPINTVSVGTQVSGIVEHVLVDYNDEVKEGQLLARLDTAVLVENKNDAKARLDLAHAKKKVADLNFKRYEKLFKDKLIAKATLEEAEVNLAIADADVLTATADYNKAERNYGYAQITSPVSGTVISKEVEKRTAHIRKHIRAAVMGCVVNGPGEAREADVGIAGGKDKGVLFIHGESVRSVPKDQLLDTLLQEIERISSEGE